MAKDKGIYYVVRNNLYREIQHETPTWAEAEKYRNDLFSPDCHGVMSKETYLLGADK